MPNPSTEGGSGAGTEVLRRAYTHAFSNSSTVLLQGAANHVYTILSIIFCEQSNNAEFIHMNINADSAGTNIALMYNQAIGAERTFIWNDKFVITETDTLQAQLASAGNVDAWVSYIDQEFAA